MKFMKNIAIYTLFAAIFAPQAQAMSILPKAASRVAAIAAKSPSVRTALTQVSKAGTQELSGIANKAERQFMTSAQPGAKFAAIPAKPIKSNLLVARVNSNEQIRKEIDIAMSGFSRAMSTCPGKTNTDLKKLMQSPEGQSSLRAYIRSYPDTASLYADFVLENFETIIQTGVGRELVVAIARKDFGNRRKLFYALDAWLKKMRVSNNFTLSNNGKQMADGSYQCTFIQELQSSAKNSLSRYEAVAFQYLYNFLLDGKIAPTALRFALSHDDIRDRTTLHHYNDDRHPKLLSMFDKVISLETLLLSNNEYYTFTHGRSWQYRLPEMVYRHCWEQVNGQRVKDFIFTHTKPYKYCQNERKAELEIERKLREDINKGYKYPQTTHKEILSPQTTHREICNRQLFMNSDLGENIGNPGSSSFRFFSLNENIHDRDISIKNMYKYFNKDEVYEKYKVEFQQIEKEHTQLSSMGEVVVIGVPKSRIKEFVNVVSSQAGQKYDERGNRLNTVTINGVKTDDIQTILEMRKQGLFVGEEEINFTLALTDTAGLNPDSGIKMYSVHTADSEEYAAWQAKFNALMEKVASEIKSA